jgi:hypothetical protein
MDISTSEYVITQFDLEQTEQHQGRVATRTDMYFNVLLVLI